MYADAAVADGVILDALGTPTARYGLATKSVGAGERLATIVEDPAAG